MQTIHLISVKNIISRTVNGTFQEISFAVHVQNLGHGKQVEVHWCGEDGVWQMLPATYRFKAAGGGELWRAEMVFPLTMNSSIPGNIQFAARVAFEGEEHWDSHFGLNYRSDADSGVIVFEPVETQVLEYHPILKPGRVALPIEVAVRQDLAPEAVTIHWSVDGWVTEHHTHAYFRHNHWDRSAGSNARNPNRYGWGVWAASIPLQHAYRLEYAVECRTRDGVFWDNRNGQNYATCRGTLRAMILNLHTYQEADQQEKFKQIARAITEKKIDLVCLQEVGEDWNNGEGDWASNAARIINSHLPKPYHLHTDWSHLGFDRYREGVAILSRYPFVYTDSGYVSDSQDPYDIHSRKVVMAKVRVPYFGLINLFSAHLSWPSDGFFPQFDRLREWAAQHHTPEVTATLLGGDFNIAAGSEAYRHIVDTGEFEDQYLKIRSSSVFQQVFRQRQGDTMPLLAEDGRIDYLWLRNGNRLRAIDAEELFTPDRYGRVSDHTAYWVEFEQR